MNAYRCDGCNQYFDHDPKFVIEPVHAVMQWPREWHVCSVECLATLAADLQSDSAS